MVGRVGYAPTTPAMSMQYSTIELTALTFRKLFNCLDRLGCFNFLRALASICLILSLVTENWRPTSSKDQYSFLRNLILNALSSLGVRVDKIFVVARSN